ncbi:FAD/NAD(P)-binding domain-containing protein [Hypoxylon sp. NC1633]|nr:FAD/NAD(P)-binding domain-containing protein [Hypoxylon sp. NC1633]
MPLKVLVIGAGICGPAFATLLRRADPENSITVVERHSGIRHSGLQIDLRSWGVPMMQRLRLLDAVREKCVAEDGMAFVDKKGKQWAAFGVDKSGTGRQSFTSEFEIMRGDLSDVLYDASLKDLKVDGEARTRSQSSDDGPGVRYKFNTTVTGLAQDEKGVDVTFSDGTAGRYDLVAGADGQWSSTRRLIFGEEASNDMFKRLNFYAAYFTIPRLPEDENMMHFHQAGEGRILMRRTGDLPYTQVYLMMRSQSDEVRQSIERQPVEKQKEVFERAFKDVDYWEMDRFLKGLRESTDFYSHSIGQVKAPHMVKGRVALLGDAGCCASPVSGMGTTVSLITAWTLAGELARNTGDVPQALRAYQTSVRPYVERCQKLAPGVPVIMAPYSGWAILLFRLIVGFVSFIRLHKILALFMIEENSGLRLPEYPELNLVPAAKSS